MMLLPDGSWPLAWLFAPVFPVLLLPTTTTLGTAGLNGLVGIACPREAREAVFAIAGQAHVYP